MDKGLEIEVKAKGYDEGFWLNKGYGYELWLGVMAKGYS